MSVTRDVDAIATFDWTQSDSPSLAVVTAVAAESDEDPTALDPLSAVVDPDWLNSVFAPSNPPRVHPTASVGFGYHDYWVILKANGRGYLYEQDVLGAPAESTVAERVRTTVPGDAQNQQEL